MRHGERPLLIVLMACVPLAVLAVIEGAASYVHVLATLTGKRPVAESRHTEYDPLLGWINRPGLALADMYGPGVGLYTNAQRFRHRGEVAARAPAGVVRVICSGDSFTLGYGVDQSQTWCALLGTPGSMETINMGQGGYGIDQAYLWFVRDGLPLRPDVQVFAFITEDYERMKTSRFIGYTKPSLVKDGDGVRATGVPVPSPGIRPWLAPVIGFVRSLRTYEVLTTLARGARDPAAIEARDRDTFDLAAAAFRDLEARHRAAGTRLLVVHLPRDVDFLGRSSDGWRRWARDEAQRGSFTFVDLVVPFRRLPSDSIEAMFIRPDALPYHGAEGHYTAAGNAWVAAQLRPLLLGARSPSARHGEPADRGARD